MSDTSVDVPDRWTLVDIDEDFDDDGFEAHPQEGDDDGAQ